MTMRIAALFPQAALPSGPAPRLRPRGTPAPPAPHAAAQVAWLTADHLPHAVIDRLAGLLAADPGLAEAVTAHLPAARQASALDLATYGPGGAQRRDGARIDTSG